MTKQWVLGIAVVAAILGAVSFQQLTAVEPPQYARIYQQPFQLAFTGLYDQRDNQVDQQIFQGKWSLVFLGYTFCPDICPTTMSNLNRLYQKVSDSYPDLQIVFVSVDPKRDHAARLAEYTDFFNQDFVSLSGQHPQLFPFVRQLGLMYSMSDDTSQPNYTVDHSASISIVNPEAQVIGSFKPVLQPGVLSVVDNDHIETDLASIIRN